MSPEPATATIDRDAPVTLPKADIAYHVEEPTRLYELRVLEGCPKQTINVAAGRATFSAFAGNPQLSDDGTLVGRLTYPRQRLTDAEVAAIKEYVKRHVVLQAPSGTGNVYEIGHAALRGQKNIRPLAEFLSLVPIPESAVEAETAKPVSMAG